MDELYTLSQRMATRAQEMEMSFVLVVRKDGTFMLTIVDPVEAEDRIAEGTDDTVIP